MKLSRLVQNSGGIPVVFNPVVMAIQVFSRLENVTASTIPEKKESASISPELEIKMRAFTTELWETCFKELNSFYDNRDYGVFLKGVNAVINGAEHYTEDPKIASGLAQLYAQRGSVYRARGSENHSRALKDYERALSMDPNNPLAKRGKQAMAIQRGEYPVKNYYPFQPTIIENHKPK